MPDGQLSYLCLSEQQDSTVRMDQFFAGFTTGTEIAPTAEDVEGFNRYIEAYKRGLAIEQAAVANKA